MLGELARDRIVLLSTHIVSDLESTATRVALIDRGRLVADGTPEELRLRSASSSLEDVYLAMVGTT
jgi:ABC-type multidrug transport system ATPase subunit